MVSVVVCLVLGLVLVAAAGLKLAGGARARAALASYGIHDAARGVRRVGEPDRRRVGPGRRRRRRQCTRRERRRAADGRRDRDPGRRDPQWPGGRAVRLLRRQGDDREGLRGPRGGARRRARARARPAARASRRRTSGWRSGSRSRWLGSSRSRSWCSRSRARSGCCGSPSPRRAPSRSPTRARRSAPTARSRPASSCAQGRIGLAVFTSEGCGLCRVLAPAITAFGTHPSVILRTFDEVERRRRLVGGRRPRQPVRRRARRRRHRAREGHLQHGRAARVRARRRRTSPRGRFAHELRGSADRRRGRRGELAPRLPRPRRRRRDGRRRRQDDRIARRSGRGRGVPLLRPHLHDRQLPAPDRPPAHRRPGSAAEGQGRTARRRPRPLRR